MLVTKQEASSGEGQGEEVAVEGAGLEGGGDGGGGGGGGDGKAVGDGVPLVELKSFTTQAFFACWRGVHLGVLQVGGVDFEFFFRGLGGFVRFFVESLR